jgi:hypothetical protein
VTSSGFDEGVDQVCTVDEIVGCSVLAFDIRKWYVQKFVVSPVDKSIALGDLLFDRFKINAPSKT